MHDLQVPISYDKQIHRRMDSGNPKCHKVSTHMHRYVLLMPLIKRLEVLYRLAGSSLVLPMSLLLGSCLATLHPRSVEITSVIPEPSLEIT